MISTPPGGSPAVRVYGNLRTAHLERFAEMTPADVIYRRRRYDFDPAAAGAGQRLLQLGRLRTMWYLLRHHHRVVEVNEPLVSNRWPDLAGQLIAIRLGGLLRRRRTVVAAYCIGLSDPADELAARRRWLPRAVARVVTWLAAAILVRDADRLAFGTTGSLELYRSYVGSRPLDRRARLFEAVPAPCPCLPPADPAGDLAADPDRRHTVLFVGAFSPRKGIGQLMAAWDVLRRTRPELRLHLIGTGDLLPDVQAWAASRPEVLVEVDPPRERIHAALRGAQVLVLLSQRVRAWREQVGLPIVEGLAHGLEIVASSETGLADWLKRHGHRVVDPAASPAEVAAAVRAALDGARDRGTVLADLPPIDQRIAADAWLLGG